MKPIDANTIARLKRYGDKDRAMAVHLLMTRGFDVGEFAPEPRPRKPRPKVRKGEITEAEALAKYPCVHRGIEVIGHHICKPCQGGREHDIFWCSLLGKGCTARASGAKHEGERVAVCLACEVREATTESHQMDSAATEQSPLE